MKNKKIYGMAFIILLIGVAVFYVYGEQVRNPIKREVTYVFNSKVKELQNEVKVNVVKVDRLVINVDKDGDGILDLDDLVEGARKDAKNKPIYKSVYYDGGYPPDSEGVCTDVVWRAFKNSGYNLKEMVDKDIRENPTLYPRVKMKPDPNIDFRRVPNLKVFFKRHAKSCTLELKPGDSENLKNWQGGDIVIFENPDHIGIISDKRNYKGVPYMIHNSSPYTRERDDLEYWIDKITGHFRFPDIH